MQKLALIINEQTKEASIVMSDNPDVTYFIEKGFTWQEVEHCFNGSWYLQGFAPKNPPLSDAEIKELRAKEYITIIDPITAEISRLRDEEQTDVNQNEINELIQIRQTKVEEIKNQYPYNA